VDRSSVGIPYWVCANRRVLDRVLSSQGQEGEARTIMQQTPAIAKASGLDDVLGVR